MHREKNRVVTFSSFRRVYILRTWTFYSHAKFSKLRKADPILMYK